ncbi:hypothetical protein GGS21DRAFT_232873 [Xylaria nigripes]|nr:hypothetical protein GGS21DRAFT_232873 [Xylaria nigripes]
MEGLIPLKLHTERHIKRSGEPRSTQTRRRLGLSLPLSLWPSHTQSRRQSMLPGNQVTRHSLPVTPLRVPTPTPTSDSEWKKAIDDVKRKYVARKYRSCSMICCEILEGLANTSDVQPLYLVYIHFYAASSFEWCAWSLSSSSAYRTKLLSDARTHYAETEVLLVALESNIAERADSPSSISTASLSSPGLSVSSRTWSSSSTASSPRTSIFSIDEEAPVKPAKPHHERSRKKVSFSKVPELIEFQPEPYIRPDSPTLGLSPEYLPSYSSIRIPPEKSISEEKTTSTVATAIEKVELNDLCQDSLRSMTPIMPNTCIIVHPDQVSESSASSSRNAFDLISFVQTRNHNRHRAQLLELKGQVSRHRAAVDNLLALPENPPTTATQSIKQVVPQPARHTWATFSSCGHKHRLSMGPAPGSEPNSYRVRRPTLRVQTAVPGTHHRSRSHGSLSAGASEARSPIHQHDAAITPSMTPTSPSARSMDESIQDRVERLRSSGWRRQRFDSRRYEDLREQVSRELGSSS